MGPDNRVEGRGGFGFERWGSAVVDAFAEETSWELYVGGDHKEELGREEGAKKGGRKEGTEGVLGLDSAAKIAPTLER